MVEPIHPLGWRPHRVFVKDSVHEHQPIGLALEDHAQPPFSAEQIANIFKWQHSGIAAIRCPNIHRGPDEKTVSIKSHGVPNDDRLVPFEHGLACPLCGYTAKIVPHIIADGSGHAALVETRDARRKKNAIKGANS